jgi:hypothetical protein
VYSVEGGEDNAEVTVRRSAVEERSEPPCEFTFLAAKPRNLNAGIGPGQHREQSQQENLIEVYMTWPG